MPVSPAAFLVKCQLMVSYRSRPDSSSMSVWSAAMSSGLPTWRASSSRMRRSSEAPAPSSVTNAGTGSVVLRAAARWAIHCCHSASLTAKGSSEAFIDSAAL